MKASEAVSLIESAVKGHRGVWADLGAGTGTFTRALAQILGPGSRIYAVDQDRVALDELRTLARELPDVAVIEADFTEKLPGLKEGELDGILLANALHFVRDAESVLGKLVKLLRDNGRVVVVEYDRRVESRWVRYPVPITRLDSLAAAAGLTAPVVTTTRPSDYEGIIYVAWAHR